MKSSLHCCAPIAPGFSIPNLSQIVRDTNGPAVDTLVLRVFYNACCVVFKTATDGTTNTFEKIQHVCDNSTDPLPSNLHSNTNIQSAEPELRRHLLCLEMHTDADENLAFFYPTTQTPDPAINTPSSSPLFLFLASFFSIPVASSITQHHIHSLLHLLEPYLLMPLCPAARPSHR